MPAILSEVFKLLIGLGFLFMPACIIWLYRHRRRDWPNSWALLAVGVCLAACGVSRVTHAFFPDTHPACLISDGITAGIIVLVDVWIPRAVYELSLLPTPIEYAEAVRKAAYHEQQTAYERQAKEALEESRNNLAAVLSASTLSDDLKERIRKAVKL
jgi:hypothetical protein